MLAQDLHGLRVRNAGKIAVYQRVQALQKRFVEKLVEESHLVRAGLQNISDDAFHHCLGEVHLIRQVREGDLRLDHPKLGRMARCVGTVSYTHLDVYKRQALALPPYAVPAAMLVLGRPTQQQRIAYF